MRNESASADDGLGLVLSAGTRTRMSSGLGVANWQRSRRYGDSSRPGLGRTCLVQNGKKCTALVGVGRATWVCIGIRLYYVDWVDACCIRRCKPTQGGTYYKR
jgi:hypothetical protein